MATPAYDSLETVMNTARSRLNDMIQSVGGDILTDNSVFTPTVVTSAWRKHQDNLAKLGFSRFSNQIVLTNLAAAASLDPAILCSLSWAGWYNGATTDATNVLPQDFILPLSVYERLNGGGPPAYSFYGMDNFTGKVLPLVQRQQWNKSWQWREETLYMPGAKSNFDLQIFYAAFLPDFVPNSTTPYASQPVPILRCLDPLANRFCWEVSSARSDLDAAGFVKDAEAGEMIMAGRENPDVLAPPAPVAA